jgi:hypothetical protein
MRRSNPICDVSTIDEHLAEYRRSVEHLERYFTNHAPSHVAIGRFLDRSAHTAGDLFTALLQQFELKPKVRQEVETSVQAWNRLGNDRQQASARRAFIAQPPVDALARLKAMLVIAEKARSGGVLHKACLVEKPHREARVGGFRVVNTGGFDKRKMSAVTNVVRSASKRLIDHGLGGVVYGEISVTNKLMEGDVLAFYSRRHDAMFVRADVTMGPDAVRTVMHELAHRLETRYIIVDSGIDTLYDAIKGQQPHAVKKAVFQIQMAAMGGAPAIQEGRVSPEYRAKYQSFVKEYGGFVSGYAATNPGENFAEMTAAYCMGTLPKSQEKMLLNVVPHYVLGLSPPAEHAQKLVDDLGREKALTLGKYEVSEKTWTLSDAIEKGALATMDMMDLVQKHLRDRALSRYWTEVLGAIPTVTEG